MALHVLFLTYDLHSLFVITGKIRFHAMVVKYIDIKIAYV